MTSKVSFIYKNIFIYRGLMSLLYGMKYKKRFSIVESLIDMNTTDIFEVCFGDIHIAKFARDHHIKWLGYDINHHFIEYAKKKGFNCEQKDVQHCDFPASDVCIMLGSLYHFIDDIESILGKLIKCANTVIISEPVKNLSHHYLLNTFCKKFTSVGKGDESFRFTEESLISTLDKYKYTLDFEFTIAHKGRDLVVVLTRC